jgi:hypothetical protein
MRSRDTDSDNISVTVTEQDEEDGDDNCEVVRENTHTSPIANSSKNSDLGPSRKKVRWMDSTSHRRSSESDKKAQAASFQPVVKGDDWFMDELFLG